MGYQQTSFSEWLSMSVLRAEISGDLPNKQSGRQHEAQDDARW